MYMYMYNLHLNVTESSSVHGQGGGPIAPIGTEEISRNSYVRSGWDPAVPTLRENSSLLSSGGWLPEGKSANWIDHVWFLKLVERKNLTSTFGWDVAIKRSKSWLNVFVFILHYN